MSVFFCFKQKTAYEMRISDWSQTVLFRSHYARHRPLRGVGLRPNNSFKPKPLRYTKGMAGKACHAFGSTTRFGLTQASCASGGDDETHMGRALGFGCGSVLERDLACSRMDLQTIRQGLGCLDRERKS